MRELTGGELDLVNGGGDPYYKECTTGTTAGGPPGVYPTHVPCNGTAGDAIPGLNAILNAIGGAGGRPA